MTHQAVYFQPTGSGPRCSTPSTTRLREHRFRMGYETRSTPPAYVALADATRRIYLDCEEVHPALARARALWHVVQHAPITLEKDTGLLGGEDPFFFNLMYDALRSDRYGRIRSHAPDAHTERLLRASVFYGPCFEGHITPGLEFAIGQGIDGLHARAVEAKANLQVAQPDDLDRHRWYEAALLSCDAVLAYTRRYREAALALAGEIDDAEWANELRFAARLLDRVPAQPARTFVEALQAYWIAYILVTLEMGGCMPGGGLGLGRLDQFLYPYYQRDTASGVLTRAEALAWMERFLLCFRHVDYYTNHQVYTPGSQASLGGVTPTGLDAANELTELVMEASLRIAMPTPYISLRLHRGAPERYWQASSAYVAGGLGFAIVNDEVLIPAFLRHGRALGDARDYICSCCYENTIPGREAFHPNGTYLNLPYVLELTLNNGRSQTTDTPLGLATTPGGGFTTFEAVQDAFRRQLSFVIDRLVTMVNRADAAHSQYRRYPLMSVFIDDCIARGQDVCAGGARYNLTGCIVAGLPNVVNSLAAIRHYVFDRSSMTLAELMAALQADFKDAEPLRQKLLAAPKWGNGDARVDALARWVSDLIYAELAPRRNARGGRWQAALYSFIANHHLGSVVGASADGRRAGTSHTRNLNPSWGTDHSGPTAVLQSLSTIDFTQFPDGCALDLRFDPAPFDTPEGRELFAGFLKGFVDLGVMQMQISMVDTETLLDARAHPERWPNLMVKVAGYSARFVDLSDREKDEIIARTAQRLTS
ncbi:MAG: hypothetical protein JXC32_08880 [Anaerolineae bacterium]|nr:hypothetical protein [Anaerolineae bacterium]